MTRLWANLGCQTMFYKSPSALLNFGGGIETVPHAHAGAMEFRTKKIGSRATRSSGSPPNGRATMAMLRCAENALQPIFFHARGGAFACVGTALRRSLGVAPFINHHHFTSGGGPSYRYRMSHLTVPQPHTKFF
jgi:hypothetical protein